MDTACFIFDKKIRELSNEIFNTYSLLGNEYFPQRFLNKILKKLLGKVICAYIQPIHFVIMYIDFNLWVGVCPNIQKKYP